MLAVNTKAILHLHEDCWPKHGAAYVSFGYDLHCCAPIISLWSFLCEFYVHTYQQRTYKHMYVCMYVYIYIYIYIRYVQIDVRSHNFVGMYRYVLH